MADRLISNKQLAEKVGVHPNTISSWKLVDSMPKINSDEIEALCEALNCSPAQLLGMEEIN
jgi:putative transcriptional regulator